MAQKSFRHFLSVTIVLLFTTFAHPQSAETPQPDRVFNVHGKVEVLSVAISADGRYLAAGCNDRTVELWDIAGGTLLRTFRDTSTGFMGDPIVSVAFSPDAKVLAAIAKDTTLYLWDVAGVADPKIFKPVEHSSWTTYAISFSPDGRLLAVGEWASVRLRDGTTGATIDTFTTKGIYNTPAVAFAPNGDLAVATSQADSSAVEIWSPLGSPTHYAFSKSLSGLGHDPRGLTYSPDGRSLAAVPEYSLPLWNVDKSDRTDLGFSSQFRAVAFSHDSRTLAATTNREEIWFWDVAERDLLMKIHGECEVYGLAFTPDNRFVAVGTSLCGVQFWSFSRPLGFDEIHAGLKNGISSSRMKELVDKFGVSFVLTKEQTKQLRDAGADAELLFAITQNKK